MNVKSIISIDFFEQKKRPALQQVGLISRIEDD